MGNWRRRIGLGLVAAAILAALAWGFMPQPATVDTAQVTRGPLAVTVDEEGRTRVIDRFVISAPVAGFARRVELDVGDAVGGGGVLARLEPSPSEVLDPRTRAEAEARVDAARDTLEAAKSEAEAAEAQAEYARSENARLARLRERELVSADAAERAAAEARRAEAALRAARAAVRVAQHELAAARTALRYSAATAAGEPPEIVALRAPVDGRVLEIHHESAGPVESGQPLLTMGDPRALEVEVDVLSEDAVRIEPGGRVVFERWGGDGELEGVVRTVEPFGFTKISALGVEEQRVLVIADFTSPPERWSRLGHGYRVEARFIVWEADDVLRVPASALFRYRDGRAVFAVEGGRARRRIVEIGHRNGLRAEVLDGLVEGETVIVHPGEEIEDGARVKLRERS